MLNFIFKPDRKNNILSILQNLYLLILAISWVLFILYLRILVEGPKYTYDDLKYNLTRNHYIMFSMFIAIQVIIFIITLVILLRRKHNVQFNSLFFKIGKFFSFLLDKIYRQPLEYVHDTVASHIPGSGRFFYI